MADILNLLRDYARHATVIVALPYSVAYGEGPVIAEGEQVFEFSVKPVSEWPLLFKMMLLQRGEEITSDLEDAAHYSGGIPRIFLQLMGKASIRVEGGGPIYSFADTLNDHVDSRRRVLDEEDQQRFREFVAGADVSMTPDLLLRYLAYGHLLVADDGAGGFELMVHPLVQEAVKI